MVHIYYHVNIVIATKSPQITEKLFYALNFTPVVSLAACLITCVMAEELHTTTLVCFTTHCLRTRILSFCVLFTAVHSGIYNTENSTMYTTMQYTRWRAIPDLLLLWVRLETRLL
jgi:hypothetical protein